MVKQDVDESLNSSIKTVIYVIDTSYLIEYFNVDGYYEEKLSQKVKTRINEKAGLQGNYMFIPLPCVFELGNHIAYVRNVKRRQKLAELLLESLEYSLWKITPKAQDNVQFNQTLITKLCSDFATTYTRHSNQRKKGKGSLSLVDIAVIAEAKRLKEAELKRSERTKRQVLVHIWTLDNALKSEEPDNESDEENP